MAQIPIGFEPNLGQAPGSGRFVSRGLEYSLALCPAGVNLKVATGKTLDVRFVDSNVQPRMEGIEAFSYTSNYFSGNNPDKWLKDIPNFAKVRYSGVWKGIDLIFYGRRGILEYDLIVAPGANPLQAALSFPGATVHLNQSGNLLVRTVLGDFVQNKPRAYQTIGGQRREIAARYRIAGDRIGFETGKYDPTSELVIDPQLTYSIGQIDSRYITASGVGVDNANNNYVGGTTGMVPVNGAGALATTAWLAKLDMQGNILFTATIAAGDGGNVTVNAFTTDPAGNVYITGSTTSTAAFAIPVTNGFQTAPAGGGTDAFLEKIATVGNHISSIPYGTYFGGTGADSANAISVPANDLVLIAGQTNSPNIHNTTSQTYSGGVSDAFVAHINTFAVGASSLVYSTFMGGTGDDSALAVSADYTGIAYVAGRTTSSDFHPAALNFQPASLNGFQTVKTNNNVDGFLVKLSVDATSATYFTFFPSGPISAIATDLNSNAFTAGTANGFIPTNSVVPGYQVSDGTGHAFVARFNTNATGVNSLAYASYLGGNGFDTANAVATDGNNKEFVTGSTTSSNFPTLNPTQGFLAGNTNAFVTVVDTTKSGPAGLVFSTYLGGSGPDFGTAISVNQYGNPTVAGQTASPNFPVTPGKAEGASNTRAFVSKILLEASPIGSLDCPAANSTNCPATNLFGAINVTGWALSSATVSNVAIYRDPLPGEPTQSNGLVFVANAYLVPGSRPDVAAAFPGFPHNDWGWGVQILTNQLTGTGGQPIGNGSYRIHAIATDPEGLSTEIGAVNITVNNAASILPFGTIDTPTQGGVASGTAFVNFGWVMTPQPNLIPIDGSTIVVLIDNKVQPGHPMYNFSRCDVDQAFPNLKNSGSTDCTKNGTSPGPVGYYIIDTTKFTNGLHTISWTATDSAGNVVNFGSRFFMVQN